MPEGPKTVLVTGAGRRVGRVIATTLGAAGWTVAVHYNTSAGPADETVSLIEQTGGRAEAFRADLANPAAIPELIAAATEALGPLSALVNNASIFERDTLQTLTLASWQRHLDANLRAPILLSQAFAAALRERPPGETGAIVHLLDEQVRDPLPGYFSYTTAKAGLAAMVRPMARALAPQIRVNGVGPGYTLPEAGEDEEGFPERHARTPLNRGSHPEDIADAIRFLLEAPAISGEILLVDGGQNLAQ